MNKIKSILLIVCVIVGFFSILNIESGNATSLYNWLLSPSFELTENIFEDSSFETELYEVGVLYGNVSSTSTTDFLTPIPRTGTASLRFWGTGKYMTYVFTSDQPLGVFFEVFSAYFWASQASYISIKWGYTDDTTDLDTNAFTLVGDSSYNERQILDYSTPNPIKYVENVTITLSTSTTIWMDDVILNVAGMGSGGQTLDESGMLDLNTEPWYSAQNHNYCGITTSTSYTGNASAFMGFEDYNAKLIQNIDYLDSDTVYYITIYVKINMDVAITCRLIYSDGTSSSQSKNGSSIGSWELMVFSGSTFLKENKYILEIQFTLFNEIDSTVLFDDAGLWSTLEIGQQKFEYHFSPNPIEEFGYNQYYMYQGITYSLIGTIYDDSGEKTYNGTYQIISSYPILEGTVTLGEFSATFVKRSGTGNFSESIGVTIITDEVFVQTITIYWIYQGGGGGGDEERASNLLDWIVMFMVMFLPAILLGSAIYENNRESDSMHIPPIYGVIAGLIMSIGIGVFTGLVPLWILILTIIAIVILILGMLKT